MYTQSIQSTAQRKENKKYPSQGFWALKSFDMTFTASQQKAHKHIPAMKHIGIKNV